jgi:hypothetical protein
MQATRVSITAMNAPCRRYRARLIEAEGLLIIYPDYQGLRVGSPKEIR